MPGVRTHAVGLCRASNMCLLAGTWAAGSNAEGTGRAGDAAPSAGLPGRELRGSGWSGSVVFLSSAVPWCVLVWFQRWIFWVVMCHDSPLVAIYVSLCIQLLFPNMLVKQFFPPPQCHPGEISECFTMGSELMFFPSILHCCAWLLSLRSRR